MKPDGKARDASPSCGVIVVEPTTGSFAVEASAAAPATFANVLRETFLLTLDRLLFSIVPGHRHPPASARWYCLYPSFSREPTTVTTDFAGTCIGNAPEK